MVLVADQAAIESITVPGSSEFSFLWAVDLSYDPGLRDYPEGYKGKFRVHPSAILHDLYTSIAAGVLSPVNTPLAAGAVSPVEIWRLIKEKPTKSSSGPRDEEDDEEDEEDNEEDEDEQWIHEEL